MPRYHVDIDSHDNFGCPYVHVDNHVECLDRDGCPREHVNVFTDEELAVDNILTDAELEERDNAIFDDGYDYGFHDTEYRPLSVKPRRKWPRFEQLRGQARRDYVGSRSRHPATPKPHL